jgi:hypothetical protein
MVSHRKRVAGWETSEKGVRMVGWAVILLLLHDEEYTRFCRSFEEDDYDEVVPCMRVSADNLVLTDALEGLSALVSGFGHSLIGDVAFLGGMQSTGQQNQRKRGGSESRGREDAPRPGRVERTRVLVLGGG